MKAFTITADLLCMHECDTRSNVGWCYNYKRAFCLLRLQSSSLSALHYDNVSDIHHNSHHLSSHIPCQLKAVHEPGAFEISHFLLKKRSPKVGGVGDAIQYLNDLDQFYSAQVKPRYELNIIIKWCFSSIKLQTMMVGVREIWAW